LVLTGFCTSLVTSQEDQQAGPFYEKIAPGPKDHPVIFEPLTTVHLTTSSYKVTSYVDFRPHMQAFKTFKTFLTDYASNLQELSLTRQVAIADSNPDEAFWRIHQFEINRAKMSSQLEEMLDEMTRAAQLCAQKNMVQGTKDEYGCHMSNLLAQLRANAQYQMNIFQRVYERFIDAIDHMDDPDADLSSEPQRRKRATQAESCLYCDVTDEEIDFLDLLIKTYDKKHAIKRKSRKKRFGFLTLFMGWGVYSNHRNVRKLKRNMKILQDQNILQDKQIRETAHYLNLTTLEVLEHRRVLTELDYRIQQLANTNSILEKEVDNLRYVTATLVELQSVGHQLTMGIDALSGNVDRLYEYMRVLASHEVHPMILPPRELKRVLEEARPVIRETDSRLAFPADPEADIWSYYPIMRITPIVAYDCLIILLTIPLVDRSNELSVYKVHNLPALDPSGLFAFTYELEGDYLALTDTRSHLALPSADEVHLCQTTRGHVCSLSTALYTAEGNTWCLYALFTNDKEGIEKRCRGRVVQPTYNRAVNLGGYIWAISSIKREQVFVRCALKTTDQWITPPLHILNVPNGCAALAPSLLIPARNDISAKHQSEERTRYFVDFNQRYQNISGYGVWNQLEIQALTEDQLKEAAIQFEKTAVPLPMDLWKQKLKLIDTKYPWSFPTRFLLIGMVILTIVVIVGAIWWFLKWRGVVGSVTDVTQHIPVLQQVMPKLIQFAEMPPTPPQKSFRTHRSRNRAPVVRLEDETRIELNDPPRETRTKLTAPPRDVTIPPREVVNPPREIAPPRARPAIRDVSPPRVRAIQARALPAIMSREDIEMEALASPSESDDTKEAAKANARAIKRAARKVQDSGVDIRALMKTLKAVSAEAKGKDNSDVV